jgi:hypothetical protein
VLTRLMNGRGAAFAPDGGDATATPGDDFTGWQIGLRHAF